MVSTWRGHDVFLGGGGTNKMQGGFTWAGVGREKEKLEQRIFLRVRVADFGGGRGGDSLGSCRGAKKSFWMEGGRGCYGC